jgi:cysteine desulfurase
MSAPTSTSMIYLDNAATTIVPENVLKQMIIWTNKGNPSASYKTAKESSVLMQEFRAYIANACGFISYEQDATLSTTQMKKCYQIIFTSGASESNNTIIKSVASAYKFHAEATPHIITSSIEHKSLLECVQQLVGMKLIELTLVKPDTSGVIDPKDIEVAIRENTCLISIMSANNETGAINNIKKIGEIAHSKHVPFHTDCSQSFSKDPLNPIACNVDAFSVSFHKMHAPKGIGILVIKRQFVTGFKLAPLICGSQNCGFRGGTENMSGIAASMTALQMVWTDRESKNSHLLSMKKKIISALAGLVPCQTYTEYLDKPMSSAIQLVFISDASKQFLVNTIMLAVVKRTGDEFCNTMFKKALEDAGVIVSIGAACNTSSSKASYVLNEMNVDKYIRRGAIRISLSDMNTMEEIDRFIQIFVKVLKQLVRDKSIVTTTR